MKPVFFVLLFFTCATLAHAALILNYSLEGWAAKSDLVIYCDEEHLATKETMYGTYKQIDTLITCRVRQSFKGPLKSGDEIIVDYDPVFRRALQQGGLFQIDANGKAVPPKDLPLGRALLFLKKKTNEEGYRISTAKLVVNDKVYEYTQWGDPGPLVLVDQKPENLKLEKDEKYGEKEFLEDFQLALAKTTSDLKPRP